MKFEFFYLSLRYSNNYIKKYTNKIIPKKKCQKKKVYLKKKF